MEVCHAFHPFLFFSFSISLMEFCGFCTTWWYPDLLGSLQITRCQQEERDRFMLGELPLTTALQNTLKKINVRASRLITSRVDFSPEQCAFNNSILSTGWGVGGEGAV